MKKRKKKKQLWRNKGGGGQHEVKEHVGSKTNYKINLFPYKLYLYYNIASIKIAGQYGFVCCNIVMTFTLV